MVISEKQKSNLIIEKADFNDYGQIMEVWESSVKATHDFLKQEDFEFYRKFGFKIMSRSEKDSENKGYPILKMGR